MKVCLVFWPFYSYLETDITIYRYQTNLHYLNDWRRFVHKDMIFAFLTIFWKW
jgi:hypothetical protein